MNCLQKPSRRITLIIGSTIYQNILYSLDLLLHCSREENQKNPSRPKHIRRIGYAKFGSRKFRNKSKQQCNMMKYLEYARWNDHPVFPHLEFKTFYYSWPVLPALLECFLNLTTFLFQKEGSRGRPLQFQAPKCLMLSLEEIKLTGFKSCAAEMEMVRYFLKNATGGGNGSGHDQDDSNSHRGNNRGNHRHSAHQIQQLEAIFKVCPNPDENQRHQLSRELGLEPQQIKFWFQNKKSQTRVQSERADNTALRVENERVYCENLAMREAQKNLNCTACGGLPFNNGEDEEQQQHILESLKQENAFLKEEHAKATSFLSNQIGRPASQILASSLLSGSPMATLMGSFPTTDPDLTPGPSGNSSLPFNLKEISDSEESLMAEIAAGAMDELLQLLRINEPLWINSSSSGKYVLHRESYEKLFPKAIHFRSTTAQVESSKDGCLVAMRGEQIVEMFVDPNKWVDLFPTIVTKASTIHVLGTGLLGNSSSSLQLMYAQMHTLSPLVAPREFYILRYCQNIESGMWVIADVSYECSRENQHITSSRCWRLPSGCLIEDMPGGYSKVTWVEHVEVDDKTLTHRLYRGLLSSCALFGAERWTVTLRRMCERFTYPIEESTFINEFGVITSPEGKRGIKKLAHRMVKSFCAKLSMPGKMDSPHPPGMKSSGVQISVRMNMELGQPRGMIVSAATSLWLPLSPQDVFNFLRDEKTRAQWDTLSNENDVHEIARIPNGTQSGNSISVIQPYIPIENQMLILQESSIDQLGSLIVYAPIDASAINVAVSGEDPSNIPLLPSGLIISGDGHAETASGSSSSLHPNKSSGGSLLTVALQILLCGTSSSKQLDTESVSTITTLISSTVQRIKVALNCDDLD